MQFMKTTVITMFFILLFNQILYTSFSLLASILASVNNTNTLSAAEVIC